MRRFGVIGLGNFGFYAAKTFAEEGVEVIAIDTNADRVNSIAEFVEQAVVADASDIEVLRKLEIANTDAVIISTGESMQQSILITMFLKELDAANVIVKAISEDHARVLEKVGADKVVMPEKETAIKTARSLSTPNMIDFVPLMEDYMIAEISPGKALLGKSLEQSELRSKYHVQLLAIKEVLPDRFIFVPPADYRFKDSDIIVILGRKESIDKLRGEDR
ncbi:MAG: potassium channel family protein [Candidatus Zixiibacteriota bacterium]